MIALPRSATKGLGRWPWKSRDVLDTREGEDREALKAFEVPASTPEELKAVDSQPIEHEVTAPIVRSASKLVKKRDTATVKPKEDAGRDGREEKDGPAPPSEPQSIPPSRPTTPSVDSETAEHIIVPLHEPASQPPAPKHNVLVKKNSRSKRAAAKSIPAENVPDGPEPATKLVDVTLPLDVVVNRPKETKVAEEITSTDGIEPPHVFVDPAGPIEQGTPTALDIPVAPLGDHGLSPSSSSSQVHPFPIRGVTPPNGTRFIEGTDGSLEPTESRTTGATGHVPRPARPQRRISLRSFGFFYGKDSRLTSAFPSYVPPTERVVYEVGDEVEETPVQRPASTRKRTNSRLSIGLLGSRKPAAPKVTRGDRRAVESALSLRALIIGPAAMEARDKDKGKRINDPRVSSASVLRKVNQQLLIPAEANRVIAALRDLPPPDLPPTAAQTVETVRKKKGWVFGRGGTKGGADYHEALKGNTGTVAIPIHGCCLDITDEEADEKHFSKLTGSSLAAPGSAVGTETSANTGSADLSSLIPMLKNLRLVNLQTSPDLSGVNAASLGAHMSASDLGFGQSADQDGPLAGSVPSAGSLVDGMEKVGQTLMSLGFATTAAVLPSHVGIHPPKDRMSVLTYWWGYEVVFPPPTMQYLGRAQSISSALLNFLTAFALFSNGVREMLPFIRYIAQFIEFEWNTIKAQDKGRGVVCAATWVMPAALAPRPWDFVDPPMNDKPTCSATPEPASTIQLMTVALTPQVTVVDRVGSIVATGESTANEAFEAEEPEEPATVRQPKEDELLDEQNGVQTANLKPEIKDTITPLPNRIDKPDTHET